MPGRTEKKSREKAGPGGTKKGACRGDLDFEGFGGKGDQGRGGRLEGGKNGK